MNEPATLDFAMSVINGGKTLRIDYKVHNRSDKRFYLSDLLPVPGPRTWALGSTDIVVMNGAEPGTVVFTRARVPSTSPLPFLVDPGARLVEPGQSVSGAAEVALPLSAQHYRGTVAPLKGKPKLAQLELGYIAGEAHWSELPLDDGRKLTISNPSDPMQLLVSERKPIPTR